MLIFNYLALECANVRMAFADVFLPQIKHTTFVLGPSFNWHLFSVNWLPSPSGGSDVCLVVSVCVCVFLIRVCVNFFR